MGNDLSPLAEGQYLFILTPEEYEDPEIRKAFGLDAEPGEPTA